MRRTCGFSEDKIEALPVRLAASSLKAVIMELVHGTRSDTPLGQRVRALVPLMEALEGTLGRRTAPFDPKKNIIPFDPRQMVLPFTPATVADAVVDLP